ncbi:acetylcholine receptor subunit alpha-like 2 [Lytechinus variegatus]|uniref:acetylcholine receptor subunit alpha-like 2 n=1 Tax=Lytechinus variegatus TaxID=7654 RepID=UPI001BB2211E|nr:acetylcholine receptor subunit alpha-like 2 [Lytechinus variegatus]
MKYCLAYLALVGVALLTCAVAQNADDYARLRNSLFTDYDKELLPRYDGVNRVDMAMTLIKLRGLDIFKGTINMNVWLAVNWIDPRLSWNPADYGNIHEIHIRPSEIWVPDISLYDSDSPLHDLVTEALAIIVSFGGIYNYPPLQLETTCTMDLKDYPYDQHECSMKFGSWSYSNTTITVHPIFDTIDLSETNPDDHPIWEIVDSKVTREAFAYQCCPASYDSVTFSVLVRRRETHGRIASSVITTWLILIVFLIGPSSAGKRIIFAGLIFVALVVLSAAVSAEVPAYSTTRLGRFIIGGMLIVALVSIYNGLVYRCYPKEKPGELVEGDTSTRSRTMVIVDVAACVCTAIILGISTGALFV